MAFPSRPKIVYPHCRHCRRGKVTRPRGLCWRCYYTPGLKDRYPGANTYGVRDYYGSAPLPEPTAVPPGTPEKVAVLEARAAAGQALWHPADATEPPDRPGRRNGFHQAANPQESD